MEDDEAGDDDDGTSKTKDAPKSEKSGKLFCFDVSSFFIFNISILINIEQSVTIEGLPEIIPISVPIVRIGTVMTIVDGTILVQASPVCYSLYVGSLSFCIFSGEPPIRSRVCFVSV